MMLKNIIFKIFYMFSHCQTKCYQQKSEENLESKKTDNASINSIIIYLFCIFQLPKIQNRFFKLKNIKDSI